MAGAINKRSLTAGATPNLVPGSIAVNALDQVFYMRANGRVVPISIPKWRDGAATKRGAQAGAPLVVKADGLSWDSDLAPSSQVGERIPVDLPPPNGYFGVPGVQITGPGPDIVVMQNAVISERFYVAADEITLERIAFYIKVQQMTAPMRIALCRDDGSVLIDTNIPNVLDGQINTFNYAFPLSRGFYRLALWTQAAATFATFEGFQTGQGWDLDGAGEPAFVSRELGVAPLAGGFDLVAAAPSPQYRSEPGVSRVLSMRWTLPV